MNLHIMNEAFKRNYSNVLAESVEPSYREQLRKALVMRSMQIIANGGNIKALEVELQDVIKEFFPDNEWWEVTDCNIYMDLLSGTKPREVCDHIVDQMNPAFCQETVVESTTEDSVDGFYAKMAECKTKAEVEAIVRKAKGNPNADEAYQKWLKNNPETDGPANSLTEAADADWDFSIEGFGYEVTDTFEDAGEVGHNIIYGRNGTDIVEVEVWESNSPVTVNKNLYAPNMMQQYYSSFGDFADDLKYKCGRYMKEAVSSPERTIAKVDKNLSRPADKDLVRDLALVIENDRDAYMRCLRPTIRMMKKRKANGSFDSTLAIKAFVNAVESSLKLPHFYQYHSYSMKNVGVPERYAVAQELLKRCMDEIEWENADSVNQSVQTD